MRMYLSSFRMGDHPDRLLALLDGPGPAGVAVIANAMDAQPENERLAGVEREVDALTSLGLRPLTALPWGVVAANYRADGTPHLTLRDGQALVIDGENTRIH